MMIRDTGFSGTVLSHAISFGSFNADLRRYLVFAIVLIVGFVVSFIAYQKLRLTIPGIVAVPLLAVYTMHSTLVLPVIAVSSIIVFALLELIYRRYFIYGRRLFLIGCIASIVLSVPALVLVNATDVVILTILPAIFAYFTISNVDRRYLSLGLMTADLAFLIGLGTVLTRIV